MAKKPAVELPKNQLLAHLAQHHEVRAERRRERLAELDEWAATNSKLPTCHWCGFRVGPAGHRNCPPKDSL